MFGLCCLGLSNSFCGNVFVSWKRPCLQGVAGCLYSAVTLHPSVSVHDGFVRIGFPSSSLSTGLLMQTSIWSVAVPAVGAPVSSMGMSCLVITFLSTLRSLGGVGFSLRLVVISFLVLSRKRPAATASRSESGAAGSGFNRASTVSYSLILARAPFPD